MEDDLECAENSLFEGLSYYGSGYPKSDEITSIKSMTYKDETGALYPPTERVRKRNSENVSKNRRKIIETEALDYVKSQVSLSPGRWDSAVARIRRAARPNLEAKRVVDTELKRLAGKLVPDEPGDKIDYSDMLAIEEALRAKWGLIDYPHRRLLDKLYLKLSTGTLGKQEFDTAKAIVLSMPSAIRRRPHRVETVKGVWEGLAEFPH